MPKSRLSTAESARKYAAPALEKGLDILELLATEEAGLGQTEIARRLDRSVSEIFRMLVVLQERKYVVLDPLSERYMLTTLLFEIAHRTPLIRRLTTLAGPVMQALVREVNQSAHLAILSSDGVLVIGQVNGPGNNTMSVRLGAKIELWRASSARVMLAFQPRDVLTDYFASVPLPADVTQDQLCAELRQIREAGHEVRDSFVVRGVVNISAPIFDHSGHAIAAMTVPHMERYDDPISFETCRLAVIRASAALSRNLGGGVARSPA